MLLGGVTAVRLQFSEATAAVLLLHECSLCCDLHFSRSESEITKQCAAER